MKPVETCAWFSLCCNPATTTRPHPVLGAVPICERCNQKIAAIEAKTGEKSSP